MWRWERCCHKPRKVWGSQYTGKPRKDLLEFSEGMWPTDLFWTFGLQNCEKISHPLCGTLLRQPRSPAVPNREVGYTERVGHGLPSLGWLSRGPSLVGVTATSWLPPASVVQNFPFFS